MKMLRIATVEDDTNDLEALRTHLKRYEKENGLKFLITEFRDGEDIVTDYSADYDLIRTGQGCRHYIYNKYASVCNSGI